MKIRENDLQKAIDLLRKEVPSVANELARMQKNTPGEVDLVNKAEYFATIFWHKTDIACALTESGIPVTEDIINNIINTISISDMEDCSYGWECIGNAIEEYKKRRV